MRTHIDWLTFTMSVATFTDEDFSEVIEKTWLQTFPQSIISLCFAGQWNLAEHSRAPYQYAWTLFDTGISLYASVSLNHCTVEISGAGCERLIELGVMATVLDVVKERVTRIDIACDIETEISPPVFVSKLIHERMRASGHQLSETGETCYVGSKKSDRYARVYRYFSPHPRANLLRVEHVFRKDYAKSVAKSYIGSEIEAIAKASGEAFGWAHPVWVTESEVSADISIISADRDTGNTIRWLIATAGASFRKLCAEGKIKDPEEFLVRYFLPEI